VGGDQRLVGEQQLAALERIAQVFLDLLGKIPVAVEVVGEPGAAVPAAFLGGVHRHVGTAKQLGGRQAVAPGAARQTDAGADGELAIVDQQRLAEARDQRMADAFEDIAGDRADHEDGEFVAAKAIRARFVTAHLGQQARTFLDQTVADEMAVLVVDRLETVEIDQRERALLAFGLARIVDVQRAPVGHRCQAVGQAEILELADVRQAEAHQQDHRHGVGRPAGHHDDPRRTEIGPGLLQQQSHNAGRDQRQHGDRRYHQHRRSYLLQANGLQHEGAPPHGFFRLAAIVRSA
jgi:hypothetical protein